MPEDTMIPQGGQTDPAATKYGYVWPPPTTSHRLLVPSERKRLPSEHARQMELVKQQRELEAAELAARKVKLAEERERRKREKEAAAAAAKHEKTKVDKEKDERDAQAKAAKEKEEMEAQAKATQARLKEETVIRRKAAHAAKERQRRADKKAEKEAAKRAEALAQGDDAVMRDAEPITRPSATTVTSGSTSTAHVTINSNDSTSSNGGHGRGSAAAKTALAPKASSAAAKTSNLNVKGKGRGHQGAVTAKSSHAAAGSTIPTVGKATVTPAKRALEESGVGTNKAAVKGTLLHCGGVARAPNHIIPSRVLVAVVCLCCEQWVLHNELNGIVYVQPVVGTYSLT
jgi:hypothetical protein